MKPFGATGGTCPSSAKNGLFAEPANLDHVFVPVKIS